MQFSDRASRRAFLGGAAVAGASVLNAQTGAPRADVGAHVFNIVGFGAQGDGKTLATEALQAAINACNADGGGMVLVPAGVFVIGTVELKSNVTLHLAAKSTLLGSADGRHYRAAEKIPLRGDSTLEDGNVGLLFAVDAENVTIEGTGTIDGQGAQFRSPKRGVKPPSGRGGADRPYHLLFHRCTNVRVRDVYLVASAFHSIRVIQSRFVWMNGVRIYNRVNGNNDGFHFISSEHVHVDSCEVESQDDACALFGSCRFVTVANSSFSTRWSVFRFGGGNPENITISNNIIYQTYGCPIKMHFGRGSTARNILFSNLLLQDVTGPISINVHDRVRGTAAAAETTSPGVVRDVTFQNIRGHVVSEGKQYADMAFSQSYRPGESRQCIVLNAIGDASIENVAFNDVRLTFGGGGTREEAERVVPQVAGEYFEIGTPPAYGLFARNVRGLSFNNVRFETSTPDLRPSIVLERVKDVASSGLSVAGNPQAGAALRFTDVREALLSSSRLITPAAVFLKVGGPGTDDITIEGGDISKSATPVLFDSIDRTRVRLRQ